MSQNLIDKKSGHPLANASTECVEGAESNEPWPGGRSPHETTAPRVNSEADIDAGVTYCLRSPGAAPPPVHQRVEGYELLEELGRGGMGVVYKAWQMSLQRHVALKMVLAGGFAGTQELERFHAEAKAIARLQHPHLVSIFEISTNSHLPFYAMEYMDGGTLAHRLNGQPLPPRVAATLLRSLAQAIDYAHKNGIVHRDLKPANILLSGGKNTPLEACLAKITDFGIAKHIHETNGYTRTGDILGTPHYMAPEQAAGRTTQIGPAADVYSLGAILYEMLSGRPPFYGHEGAAVLVKLAKEEPDRPTAWVRALPRDLVTICLKCLEKDPAKRYASAAALADDLTHFLQNEPIQARPASMFDRAVKWTRRRPATAAILFMATGAAVLAFTLMAMMWRQAVESASQQDELLTQSKTQLADAYLERGMYLAERGDVRRGMHWMLRSLEVTEQLEQKQKTPSPLTPIIRLNLGAWSQCVAPREVQLPHRGWVWDVVFTPDRNFVITGSRDTNVQVWDVQTGQPVGEPLSHPFPVWGVAIHPDGKTLFTIFGDVEGTVGGLCVWEAHPSRRGQFVAKGSPFTVCHEITRLEMSPQGDRVWVTSAPRGLARLFAFDRQDEGNGLRLISEMEGVHLQAAFSHDGATLATAMGNFAPTVPWSRPILESWSAVGPALALLAQVKQTPKTAQPAETVALWNARTGAALRAPLVHPGAVRALAFDKTGRQLLVGSATNQGKDEGESSMVHLWDVVEGRRLSHSPVLQGRLKTIAVAPSGQMFAASFFDFIRSRNRPGAIEVIDGHIALWRLRGDGEIESFGMQLRTNHVVWSMAFSPDSRLLLAGSENFGSFLWSVANCQLVMPPIWHEGNCVKVAWRSDGKQVVTGSAGGTSYAAARLFEVPEFGHMGISMPMPNGVPSTSWDKDGKHAWISTLTHIARWNVLDAVKIDEFPLPEFSHNILPMKEENKLLLDLGNSRIREFDTTTRVMRKLPRRSEDHLNNSIPFVNANAGILLEYWHNPSRFQMLNLDGSVRHSLHTDAGYELSNIRLSPQGDTLVVAQTVHKQYNRLVVFDVNSELRVRRIIPLQQPATTLTISPDGQIAAFGGTDRQVQTVDLQTGKFVGVPLFHEGPVHIITYFRDSRLLITGADKGLLQVWDTATGKRIGPAMPHGTDLFSVASQPQGDYVLTTNFNKIGMTWRLPSPVEGSLADLRLWVETRTGLAMDVNNTIVPIDLARLAEKRRKLDQVRAAGFQAP